MTDGHPLDDVLDAYRDALVKEVADLLVDIDAAISSSDVQSAVSGITSLQRIRDRIQGVHRQQISLVVDACWEKLRAVRRSTPFIQRCLDCGEPLPATAIAASRCQVCSPDRGSSVRAASAGLPTLGKGNGR